MAERVDRQVIRKASSGVLALSAVFAACSGSNEARPLVSPTVSPTRVVTNVSKETLTPTATATVKPELPVKPGGSINRALKLDGTVDSVEYDGAKFSFQAPLRIDARIKRNPATQVLGREVPGTDTIIAKGENDALAFFAALLSCPNDGMALVIDKGKAICGPKVARDQWTEVSVLYDGKTVTFLQNDQKVAESSFQGAIPIENGKLFVGKSPSGLLTQGYFGGEIDFIRISSGEKLLFGPEFNSDFNDGVADSKGSEKGGAELIAVN